MGGSVGKSGLFPPWYQETLLNTEGFPQTGPSPVVYKVIPVAANQNITPIEGIEFSDTLKGFNIAL